MFFRDKNNRTISGRFILIRGIYSAIHSVLVSVGEGWFSLLKRFRSGFQLIALDVHDKYLITIYVTTRNYISNTDSYWNKHLYVVRISKSQLQTSVFHEMCNDLIPILFWIFLVILAIDACFLHKRIVLFAFLSKQTYGAGVVPEIV